VNITVVGLSHKTASVEIRQKLSIPEPNLESALTHLLKLPYIKEVAIISTYNRLEIYAVVKNKELGVEEIIQFLSEVGQIPLYQLQQHLFILHNKEVVWHLLRVATGLESLILEERQILWEVKKAYKLAQTYKSIVMLQASLYSRNLILV
jgi:glutamyl-tRNA reductase